MKNVTITIKNCNQCQLDGDIKVLKELYDSMSLRHPNFYHIQMCSRGDSSWDGMVRYITGGGLFKIGMLGTILSKLEASGVKVKLIDKRPLIGITPVIPKKLGELTLRPEQKNSLRKILGNEIKGIPFQVCSANLAVNFGKSLLFCAIHKAYQSKIPIILLTNDSDLFKQFKRELPLLMDGEPITFVQGGKVTGEWNNFTVAMVQSLSMNLSKYARQLEKFKGVLIDEADIIDNKTYKTVLTHLHNTSIRIGLSGTLYKSKLKRDLIHNNNIRCFIGDMVDEVTLKDQMKKGRSTPTIVKMVKLDYSPVGKKPLDYQSEYRDMIIEHPEAYKAILRRVQYNLKYGRTPMMVVTKFIDHCELVTSYLKKNLPNLIITGVHHKTKARIDLLEDFRVGKTDILVVTTIITRGKNVPMLKYTCNATSMDGEEKSIQLLGRSVRKHESKTKSYIDDLCFPGTYLSRHGKHRRNYYLKENMKVIDLPRNKKQRKRNRKKKTTK